MGKEVVHSWTLAGGFCFRPNHRQVPDHGLYRKTLLGMHGAQDEGNAEGKELYAMLVEPARKLILPGSRVIVLPSGSLYGLNLEPRSCPIHSHTLDLGRHAHDGKLAQVENCFRGPRL